MKHVARLLVGITGIGGVIACTLFAPWILVGAVLLGSAYIVGDIVLYEIRH